MYIKLLLVALLSVQSASAYCNGGDDCCTGQCGQGEGDCDRDSDCKSGLVCDFDWWWGDDWCKAGDNTKNYEWASWDNWGDCSVSCGGAGIKTRTRECNPPENGGYDCPSSGNSETADCDNGPCPIDGGFSAWDDWTQCTVSCAGGEQTRARRCDSPAPEHGGKDCEGALTETQVCNENPCPIDGSFSAWDDWAMCTVSCGGGEQTRARRCDNPAPEYGGQDCEGDFTETQACNENPCPIDGGFSAWDDWTQCTVSCGGGEQTRERRCDSPAPEHGGKDCEGALTETQVCNENPCPIDGGLSVWDDWEPCPVSCGGGAQTRSRRCDNPEPQFGGLDCEGNLSETQTCNENPCPIDGGFSDWDNWDDCTATCGGGDQTRTRRCDNPAPQYDGKECEGDFTECQRCNLDPCSSNCPVPAM